jgi:hypothetical protein
VNPNRRAALLAGAIALPIAIVAGLLVFIGFHDRFTGDETAPVPSPAVSGNTGPVAMPAPTLSAAHATMCLAFVAALPKSLRDLPERHVTNGSEQNAAFGDPPITAACGVAAITPKPTDELYSTDDVCWAISTTAAGTVWTTVDRQVPVAVSIPKKYESPGQWANEFSPAIISALPRAKTTYNC